MKFQHTGLLLWHKILIVLAGFIIILTSGITFAISYSLNQAGQTINKASKQILSRQSEIFIEKLVKGQAAILDVQLKQALNAAKYGAIHLRGHLGPHKTDKLINTLLLNIYSSTSHCKIAYYIPVSGSIKTYPALNPEFNLQVNFSFTKEPFFPDPENFANKIINTVWTKVHIDPIFKNYDLVVDAVSPVFMNDLIWGYIGVSISLRRLISQFNQHQPIRSSYSFLINTNHELVGTSPHGRIDLASSSKYKPRGIIDLHDTDNADLNAVFNRMVLGETAVKQVVIRGEPKYIAYHSMQNINWRIGIVVPVKMAASASAKLIKVNQKGTNNAVAAILVWAGCLMILAFIGAVVFARYITAPVRELSFVVKEIAAGNFDKKVNISTRDEIGILGIAFNKMIKKIKCMLNDLNKINERLHFKKNELQKNRERFKSLAENSPDIIFTLNDKGFLDYLNPAFENILGYSRQEAIGKAFIDFVQDEQKKYIQIFKNINNDKQIIRNLDLPMLHKDGNIHLFSISASPNFNENKKLIGIVGVCKDITIQRKLEEKLNNALKMKAVGTLAGGIAHDFNNLLTGILGNISLMRLNTNKDHPNYEKFAVIENYVQSGTNLTRQLLGFAKGSKSEIKTINLNDLIEKSSELFGRTRKEIRIHKNFGQKIHNVEADPGQIEQVLINLYVNAWYAMPKGGDIFIQTENVILSSDYVKPYYLNSGCYVKISITDTGVGMTKAVQQRIFEPFFTTRKEGQGTGMGMASAYSIIKNHQGIINVYSEKGRGSTFIIYLPGSDKKLIKESAQDQTPVKGTGTLLLIDDEEMILEVGAYILKELGYDVITANSGHQALDIYKAKQDIIDLIILDMVMPEIGGEEVYDRLKQINSDVKVILASGYSVNGQAEKILAKGCNGFIQKPFTIKQLSEKIRDVQIKEPV